MQATTIGELSFGAVSISCHFMTLFRDFVVLQVVLLCLQKSKAPVFKLEATTTYKRLHCDKWIVRKLTVVYKLYYTIHII